MSSCAYDDTFVVNSITDLQKRVALLEQLQNASDKGLLIDSITEIEEGYIIKFSDGSEIIVYHGKDGENGADGNDGADGKDGENGKDGADGKDGSDANCIIADIVIGEDTIIIYLSDGTSFTFNRVKEETFDVVFANTEGLVCYPGASVEVAYTIVGGDDKTAIECWGNAGWDASIIKTNATEGKVKVTSPKDSKSGKVVVLSTSGNGGVVMKSLYFDEGILSDIMESYEADWQASTIEVTLKTNLNYDVRIPAEAQSWLSVADTRATLRTDKLTFTIAENPESEPARTATVELVGECGDLLQSFEITQKSQPASTPIEFADQYVKKVCVEKFDKNGDGELSPKEAAEVTSIPGYFFGTLNKVVQSFDELQYFINLKDIASYAFDGCNKLQSIILPNSLIEIEDHAFNCCDYLVSIVIPDSVTTIGWNAFYRCIGLESVTIGNSVNRIGSCAFENCYSLTSVTIGDSVTVIGEMAFYNCNSLTSVTIPDSVTSIGYNTFYDCSSLTSVHIGNGVTEIGNWAFQGCSNLTSITIGNSLASIGEYAFLNSSITSVYISDVAAWCNISFNDSYSNPLSHAGNLYLNNELVKDLIIPDGVTSIGDYAFSGSGSLTSVTIPDSVISIGDCAFSSCNSLTSVNIADGVRWIGNYAFLGSGSLTSITIPDSVISIGISAFSSCSSLTSITIPDGVTTIGSSAFSRCSSLTSITIPDGVTTIESYTFYNCSSLTSVTIPDSVTSIGGYAFSSCSSLTSVTIPDGVTSIEYNTFYDCSSLTSITIPDSVISIGNSAFYGCSNLTSVTIPDSVTSIEGRAFANCIGIKEFKGKFASEDGRYLIVDGVLNSFAIGCDATEYIIPDSVTTIGEGAFWGCSSLTSVIIPDGVTKIEAFAFYHCSSLKSVYCKATTPPAGAFFYNGAGYFWDAFGYNASGRKIYVPMESVEAYKSVSGWSEYAYAIVGYNFE